MPQTMTLYEKPAILNKSAALKKYEKDIDWIIGVHTLRPVARFFIFLIIFFLSVFRVYGQNVSVAELINRCISLLDKPVPDGFRQVNRQTFMNNEGLLLFVYNETVIVSSTVNTFKSDREAREFNNLFTDFFKNNNWNFFRTSSGGADIYVKNGLYAIIERPRRNENGLIETMTAFSRNLNVDAM
jgi:hypothetical protein